MKANRIIHIVGDSKFGGGSVVILKLAKKAKELGWDVDVLTTDNVFQKILKSNNIRVVNLDVIWRDINPIRDLIGLYRLYRYLKNSDYSIVHTHTSKAGFIGRLAAKLARVPVIIHTVHGFAFHEYSNFLVLYFIAFLEKIASHWCDSIVTVSNFHRDWAVKLGIVSSQKVVAIQNGIDLERVIPNKSYSEIRKTLEISEEEFIIFTCGRLVPQKGIEFLLRAVPLLNKKLNKPYRVLIVGDGPLRAYLEGLSRKLKIEDKVIFLGFRRDIANLLYISDVVVLPSLWEGLSIALLEAMAAGKPIITTLIGSNKEVIENGYTGILVPRKDPFSLAEAIYKILKDKESALRLGSNAYKLFLQKYREEFMLDKYVNLYKKLLKVKDKKNVN